MVSGADPGFFLGGGALVSCSTSTPINHIVFLFFGGEVRNPCTLPLNPPLGLYFIDHRNDVKMFKTLQCYTTRLRFVCSSWFHLNFEHIDAISMVDKSTDHGKCRFVK